MMVPSPELDALEREIVDRVFELQPGTAVSLGLHAYDGRLPDLSRGATDLWAAAADRLLGRLEAVDPATLPPERQVDRLVLRLLLESPLFDLREAGVLERNPMSYLGVFSLSPYLARAYAPAEARVAAMAKVLLAVPAVLESGRRRLTEPLPRVFVDLALAIGSQLPTHFGEATAFAEREGLGARLASPREIAEASLAPFLDWLRDDLAPRATGGFALGPEKFRRLLLVREGIDVPVQEIRDAGAADLRRNQVRLAELARARGQAPAELVASLGDDHPAAGELLATARTFVEEVRRFVLAKELATVPEPASCRVEETPPYSRALTTASLDPPGPFETVSAEGVYYVTLVDPTWTPEQQQEWVRMMNRPILRNTTVHEVYPGHYLQFLHVRAGTVSLARKVYRSPSFVEGWAHYAEQVAIESGLDGGRPEAEAAQLCDALLRNCRLLAAIGLHTEGWAVEQATELFRTEGHLDQLPAEREAQRGTYDPEYFCYTLGKLSILSARRRFLASKFQGNLRRFHDAILGTGAPPVGLLDRLLELRAVA